MYYLLVFRTHVCAEMTIITGIVDLDQPKSFFDCRSLGKQKRQQIMYIDDNKTISQVQAEFTKLFAGLKLEFYKKKHTHHTGSKKEEQYSTDLILADIRDQHKSGDLTIAGSMSTSELEDQFESTFGLHVQVFRKSGTIWLQTSTTDNWTLEKQNFKGLNFEQPKSFN